VSSVFIDACVELSTGQQWRRQKVSIGCASICSIPSYPSQLSCFTKSTLQSKTSWYEPPYDQLYVTGHWPQ